MLYIVGALLVALLILTYIRDGWPPRSFPSVTVPTTITTRIALWGKATKNGRRFASAISHFKLMSRHPAQSAEADYQ